jgi:formylglycine-generating enzyme required for sulfatase activity
MKMSIIPAKRTLTACSLVVFSLMMLLGGQVGAETESPLARAHALLARGQYDEAVSVLEGYIGEIREKADQKPNLAAAWYFLAEVFYEVGDDAKCDEALLQVYSAHPGFDREETNFGLMERVTKVKAELARRLPVRNEMTEAPQADAKPQKQPKEINVQPIQAVNALIEMVVISNGSFAMGSASSESYEEERPVHTVALAPFKIGKYEVTQGQWQAVMGSNPSHFPNGNNYPVENVSWNDVQTFIQKLNAMTGKRFRLPTEAEWEYACRSGTTGERYGNLDAIAWHASNSGGTTHPVGQKQANAWGLYDMLGNVSEWCQDWYGIYSADFKAKPAGPASGTRRVIRGGSWIPLPGTRHTRAARRGSYEPSVHNASLGFRLAMN